MENDYTNVEIDELLKRHLPHTGGVDTVAASTTHGGIWSAFERAISIHGRFIQYDGGVNPPPPLCVRTTKKMQSAIWWFIRTLAVTLPTKKNPLILPHSSNTAKMHTTKAAGRPKCNTTHKPVMHVPRHQLSPCPIFSKRHGRSPQVDNINTTSCRTSQKKTCSSLHYTPPQPSQHPSTLHLSPVSALVPDIQALLPLRARKIAISYGFGAAQARPGCKKRDRLQLVARVMEIGRQAARNMRNMILRGPPEDGVKQRPIMLSSGGRGGGTTLRVHHGRRDREKKKVISVGDSHAPRMVRTFRRCTFFQTGGR